MTSKTIKTSAGEPYGHVPGHSYHDVDCVLRPSRHGGWLCTLTETWGSCQGYDEEHGRTKYSGSGGSPAAACREAVASIPTAEESTRRYARTATAEAIEEAEKE